MSLQIADRWFNIRDKKSGRQFFNDTQSKVREALKQFDLDGIYEIASAGSQHVRLAGMVRSVQSSGGDLRLQVVHRLLLLRLQPCHRCTVAR